MRRAAITPEEWEHHDLMAAAYPDYEHPFMERDKIRHALNTGEQTLLIENKAVHVDGYNADTNSVYEFQCCFYHGCPKCFPNRHSQIRAHDQKTMDDVYNHAQARDRAIRQGGYNLITQWECEWNQLKKDRDDIRAFVDGLGLVPRLEPRDALFGGRTEAIQLYATAKGPDAIHYVDFTSLYPWVNKNCRYPVGHPTIITKPTFTDLSAYFGLMQCIILPPEGLYHPVLPYRANNKLLFPLCRTCIEEELPKPLHQRSKTCNHSDAERALTGTWCTPEIEEAIDQGYDVLKVHEIWHFQHTSTSLFTSYINCFVKIKQEADGWPANVGVDEEKRQEYLSNYVLHEGVQLDYINIEKNPAKRALANLTLNSFWGKFGQQPNKSQLEAITSPARLYQLLQKKEDLHLHAIRVVNPEMLEVVYNNITEAVPIQPNINIFVAAFTTCHARLHLYREGLARLQPHQVLYMDTDSLIYKGAPGLPDLPCGPYLGQFKNELDDDDAIVEFAAAGPKNYGYRTRQGKVECKVRGFSLNVRGRQQPNFDLLKKNVLDELQRPKDQPRILPVFNPHKITRDVATQTEIKRYQLVADKRVIDANSFHSFPYGFTRVPWNHSDDEDVLAMDSDSSLP